MTRTTRIALAISLFAAAISMAGRTASAATSSGSPAADVKVLYKQNRRGVEPR